VSAVSRPITVWAVVGLLLAAVYLAFLAREMATQSYTVWGGLVIAPVLIAISLPILFRVAHKTDDAGMAGLFVAALLLKFIGALVRYYVVLDVYGGNDSIGYHQWGVHLAPIFRSGDLTVDIGRAAIGTGFIEILTGWVYVFTGPTIIGGYLVYSWLGFWGLFLFYRAFRIAVPNGNFRRYALLVFFMPSMLFWSSSIGKEAWMTFALGVTAYGAARLLTHKRWGLPVVGLGLLGTVMVRPHVALVVFLALGAAYIVRPAKRASLTNPVAKVGGLVVLAVVGLIVLSQVQDFFGVQKVDSTAVEHVFDRTRQQSSQGGSEFEALEPGSPAGYGLAVVSVLFRPWPVEAHNPQALAASLEGVVLLVLCLLSFRRLAAIPRAMIRTPYVALAVVFSLAFIYAFASIGNFGIIVRQRVQLYPFVFVLLAIPAADVKSGVSRRVQNAIVWRSAGPDNVGAVS
jgi:hypothetical protein